MMAPPLSRHRQGLRLASDPAMVTITMERQAWTDERIDDMVGRLDKNMDLLRAEMHELRAEMQAGFERMSDGFAATQRQLLHAVLVITTMMVATMATLLATSL